MFIPTVTTLLLNFRRFFQYSSFSCMLSADYVNYEDSDSNQRAQKQMEEEFGSNKERNPPPPPAPSYNRHQTRTSSSSSVLHHHHHNRHDSQKNGPSSRKNHRHQKHHHHQRKKDKTDTKELLERRHKKYAKEKYQRKLERAQKMQLQREHKLEYQSRQLAELERQHQARQKVYFGNFAEDNKQFDSIADIDQHLEGAGGGGGGHQERYPNLARLQTQLKEDRDKDLPPYVRKYNRRNKQLFELIEGTNSPDSLASSSSHAGGGGRGQRKKQHHHHHHHPHNHRGTSGSGPSVDHLSHKEKIERWIAENLFEEQRRNPNQIVQPPQEDPELLLDSKINALPGELGSDDDTGHLMEGEGKGDGGGEGAAGPVANVITNRLSQTRAGNFVYHRIAQSQPSNAIGQGAAGAAYGVIVRKPGLPFVAITDRRQEHNKPKHM